MEDTDFKTDGCIEKILLFVLYFIIIILSKLIWTGLKFSVAESECKSSNSFYQAWNMIRSKYIRNGLLNGFIYWPPRHICL